MEGELDPAEAAARYETGLPNSFSLENGELPRFDLIALGMGPDGHTASLSAHGGVARNQPAGNCQSCGAESAWRVTLTWPVINRAKSVFFLISGSDKAMILKEVLTGPRMRTGCPAS